MITHIISKFLVFLTYVMDLVLKSPIVKTLLSNTTKSIVGANTTTRSASFKVTNDKDFLEKVENSKKPVIVDFFANWCGPCKTLEPRLESVLAKNGGRISLAKVDVDSMGELAAKYEVATIPSLVVFRNGKVAERLIGLQDEDKLSVWVDTLLQKKS